jgi:DNA-binding NtrC family response regulator
MDDLPDSLQSTSARKISVSTQTIAAENWTPMPLAQAMEEPERQILLSALEANGWNRQETARQLSINRTTLYKKIKQYRLDEPA